MSRCERDWTRDDLAALRDLTDCWRRKNAHPPSRDAIRRVDRIAHDVEISLQQELADERN